MIRGTPPPKNELPSKESQKLNRHLSAVSKLKNKAQAFWILLSNSGNHRAFSCSRTHCLKNRNNKSYQVLFYSKESQVSFAKPAVIFLFCVSLKRHAREITLRSCLSFENLYLGVLICKSFLTKGS